MTTIVTQLRARDQQHAHGEGREDQHGAQVGLQVDQAHRHHQQQARIEQRVEAQVSLVAGHERRQRHDHDELGELRGLHLEPEDRQHEPRPRVADLGRPEQQRRQRHQRRQVRRRRIVAQHPVVDDGGGHHHHDADSHKDRLAPRHRPRIAALEGEAPPGGGVVHGDAEQRNRDRRQRQRVIGEPRRRLQLAPRPRTIQQPLDHDACAPSIWSTSGMPSPSVSDGVFARGSWMPQGQPSGTYPRNAGSPRSASGTSGHSGWGGENAI